MGPLALPLGVLGAAAAGLAYASLYEVRAFTLREVTVPVLPAGSDPLRILHLSDAHMTPAQHRKQQWLREPRRARAGPGRQHRRQPRPHGRPAVGARARTATSSTCRASSSSGRTTTTRRSARTRPSTWSAGPATSAGRNEWWRTRTRDLPFEPMRRAFTERGWTDLTNTHASLDVGGAPTRVRRRRRPAPGVRRARRPAGRHVRRPRDRGGTCSVPARAGPVERARLPADHGRPHPRRTALRARSTARSSPTATSTASAPRACTRTPFRATSRRGCTCRQAWARRRTHRCDSPAAPRPPCSP